MVEKHGEQADSSFARSPGDIYPVDLGTHIERCGGAWEWSSVYGDGVTGSRAGLHVNFWDAIERTWPEFWSCVGGEWDLRDTPHFPAWFGGMDGSCDVDRG